MTIIINSIRLTSFSKRFSQPPYRYVALRITPQNNYNIKVKCCQYKSLKAVKLAFNLFFIIRLCNVLYHLKYVIINKNQENTIMKELICPKKKISFSITSDEYEILSRFAESEHRKVSNAARIIVMRFLRNLSKEQNI